MSFMNKRPQNYSHKNMITIALIIRVNLANCCHLHVSGVCLTAKKCLNFHVPLFPVIVIIRELSDAFSQSKGYASHSTCSSFFLHLNDQTIFYNIALTSNPYNP